MSHSKKKNQKFSINSLNSTSGQELAIIVELGKFQKRGRMNGHCYVRQRKNRKAYTRRYLTVKSLIRKGLLRFSAKQKMNLRGYTFTDAFKKWREA